MPFIGIDSAATETCNIIHDLSSSQVNVVGVLCENAASVFIYRGISLIFMDDEM